MLKFNYILNEWIRGWRKHWVVQISTLFVLTATFTIIFSLYSVLGNLQNILTKWGKEVQVTVFLEDDLSKENLSAVEEGIRQVGGFQSLQYVPKDEARERFVKQMPGFAKDVMNDPEFSNPFPASFQIGGLGRSQIENMGTLANKISELSGVEDVAYGQEWVQNYAGFLRGLTSSGAFILGTLLLGSLMIVSNSIRSALAQRKEEIEILELVGATPTMIRAPFLVDGALTGFVASALAVGVSLGVYKAGLHLVNSEMGFLGANEVFSFFSIGTVFLLVAFGTLSGALGAYVCVRKMNTGWAAGGR